LIEVGLRLTGVGTLLAIGVLVTALTEPVTSSLIVVGALLATFVLAGLSDAVVGLSVGLVGAAATLALIRVSGIDLAADLSAVAVPITMVAGAFLAGGTGSALRRLSAPDPGRTESLPVEGSLGLLHPTLGEASLRAEVERAALAGAPLSLMRFRIEIVERGLSKSDIDRVGRVVGRTVESLSALHHVCFAYSDSDVVLVLPEMAIADAWHLARRVGDTVARATVVLGPNRSRRMFAEVGGLTTTFVGFRLDGHSADALLQASSAALEQVPLTEPVEIPAIEVPAVVRAPARPAFRIARNLQLERVRVTA
jgi:hypothetical protein